MFAHTLQSNLQGYIVVNSTGFDAYGVLWLQRFAPGSDPRSDQSEQTPLSPATKANAASPMGPLAAAALPAAAL